MRRPTTDEWWWLNFFFIVLIFCFQTAFAIGRKPRRWFRKINFITYWFFFDFFVFRRLPTPSRTSRRRRKSCTYNTAVPRSVILLFIDNKKIVLSVFLSVWFIVGTTIFIHFSLIAAQTSKPPWSCYTNPSQ